MARSDLAVNWAEYA